MGEEALKSFRVIDTGLREARANIAFDQAMIDTHRAGEISNSVRFLQFERSVLVGRHQLVSREIHRDYCDRNGIGIARRITGGGAIYFDPGQLGWEFVFSRKTFGFQNLGEIAESLCEAAASGLQTLGVGAHFRPRNDIEVDGRKLCGTGGFLDGDTVFYQGTLLIDTDPDQILRTLNVPKAKLEKRALDSAVQRIVTLKELLGSDVPSISEIQMALLEGFKHCLGISLDISTPSFVEEERARQHYVDEIGTDAFVYDLDDPVVKALPSTATVMGAGGSVTAHLRLEDPANSRIREVLFSGDFFISPPRILFDLEASLRGVFLDNAATVIREFFVSAGVGTLSLEPDLFAEALAKAAVAD
jgi:lipoate---protein ligase